MKVRLVQNENEVALANCWSVETICAIQADVQLFWGEPLEGVRERIERLKALSKELDRDLPPLEFGLRITTFVRDTREQAWADVSGMLSRSLE